MGVANSAPLSVGCNREGVVRVAVKERYRRYLKDTNLNAELTEEKVKRVHDHWNFIANEDWHESRPSSQQSRISLFYDAFYERLFEVAPETRDQFEGNMVRQSRALVKMVSWLCNLEVNTETDLVAKLEALADRHFHYGCKISHYKAGGDALLHALRVASKSDGIATEVISAWEDLYSFVLLIVIPRTALLLEEEERTAGSVHISKRAAPIAASRRRASKAHDVVGDDIDSCSRSDRMSAASDGEWISSTACLSDGHATRGSPQMVRTESCTVPRSVIAGTGRRRGAPQKPSVGRRLLHDLKSSMNVAGDAQPADLRGTVATVAAKCPMGFSDTDMAFTPGDSPASMTSSVASGRQSSIRSNPNVEKSDLRPPVSPHGSATSSRTRVRGEGRTSKLLRGLGKLTSGAGGAAPVGSLGSPRGSLRSRARHAAARYRHEGVSDNGSDMRSRRRDKAGAAAPHLPLSSRRAQLRSSSEPPEIDTAKQRERFYTSGASPCDVSGNGGGAFDPVSGTPSNRGDRSDETAGCVRSISARGREAAREETCTALLSPARSTISLPNLPPRKDSTAAGEGVASGGAHMSGRMSTNAPTNGGGLSCISRMSVAVMPSEEETNVMVKPKGRCEWSGGDRKAPEGLGNGGKDRFVGDASHAKRMGRSMVGGEPPSDELVPALRMRVAGLGGTRGAGAKEGHGDYHEGSGRFAETVPGAKGMKDPWWPASNYTALRTEISPRGDLLRPEPLQLPESSASNVESISFSRNGWTSGIAHSRRPSGGPDSGGKWTNSISSSSSCSSSTRLTPGRLWGRDDGFSRRGFSRRSKERIGPELGAGMVPFEDEPSTLARLGMPVGPSESRPSSLPTDNRHGSRRTGRHATRYSQPLRSTGEGYQHPTGENYAEDPYRQRQSSRQLRRYGSTGDDRCRGRSFGRFSDFHGNRNRDSGGDSELGAKGFPGYQRSSSGVFDRTGTGSSADKEACEADGAVRRGTQRPRRHPRARSWRPYRRRASDVTDTLELLLPTSKRAVAKLEVDDRRRQRDALSSAREVESHSRGVAVTCSRQSVEIHGKSGRSGADHPTLGESTGGSSASGGLGALFHNLNLWSSTASLTPTPGRASSKREEERPVESGPSPPTPTASVTPQQVHDGLQALAPTPWPFGTSSTSVTEPATVTPTSPHQPGRAAERGSEVSEDASEKPRGFAGAPSEAPPEDHSDVPLDGYHEGVSSSCLLHVSRGRRGESPIPEPCEYLVSDRSVATRDLDSALSTFASTASEPSLSHGTKKTMLANAVSIETAVGTAPVRERSQRGADSPGRSVARNRALTVDVGSFMERDEVGRSTRGAGRRGVKVKSSAITKTGCQRTISASSAEPAVSGALVEIAQARRHNTDIVPLQPPGPELEVTYSGTNPLCLASNCHRPEPCVKWSDNRPMALPPTEDDGDRPEADRFGNGSPAPKDRSGLGARSQNGRDGRGSGQIKRNIKKKSYCGTPYRKIVDAPDEVSERRDWDDVLHPVRAIKSLPHSSLHSRQSIVLSDSDLEHSKSGGEDDYRDEVTDEDNLDSDFDEPDVRRSSAVERRGRAMTDAEMPTTWPDSAPESATDSSSPSGETEERISGPICRHLVEVRASDGYFSDRMYRLSETPPRGDETSDLGGKGIAGAVEMWTGGVLRREGATTPSAPATPAASAPSKAVELGETGMNSATMLAEGGKLATVVDSARLLAEEGKLTNASTVRVSGAPENFTLGALADVDRSDARKCPMMHVVGSKNEQESVPDRGKGRRSGETRKVGSGTAGPSSSFMDVSVSRSESGRAADRALRKSTRSSREITRNLRVREALERFHGNGAVDSKGSGIRRDPIEGLPLGTVRAKANNWGNALRSS